MTLTPQERLKALLAEMELLLPELDDANPETRARAVEAQADLQRLAERAQSDVVADDDEAAGLLDRLRDSEAEFEAAHPTFSSVVRRLIDVLGQMGI